MEQTDLSKLNPGDVLKEVDLGSYIAAMGLGVAQAQKALDENAITQLVELSRPVEVLKGKSLLQLGLLPAFYHFRKATLTASISMSLKVSRSLSVGGGLDGKSDSTVQAKRTKASASFKQFVTNFAVNETTAIAVTHSTGMSALKKIQSYAQTSSDEKKIYTIADRAKVMNLENATATGLVSLNREAAIVAVRTADTVWQLWRFKEGATEQSNFSVTPLVNPIPLHGNPGVMADELVKKVNEASAGTATAKIDPSDTMVYFDFSLHDVRKKDEVLLRAIAHLWKAKYSSSDITLTGHTDRKGPPEYNVKLGMKRAEAAKAVLVAYGVAGEKINVLSKGESEATIDEGDAQADRQVDRRVQIQIGSLDALHVYLEGLSLSEIGSIDGALVGNGLVAREKNSNAGQFVGQTAKTAEEVVQTLQSSQSHEASHESGSELVYLTNKQGATEDVYELDVYSTSAEGMTFSKNSAFADAKSSSLSESEVSNLTKETNRTTAVAANFDVRYAKTNEVSMTGNMSVSAELVSVPPPEAFIEFIRKTWED
jgi:outer membrane protein OmpA-like peptidoglycan-associated protein